MAQYRQHSATFKIFPLENVIKIVEYQEVLYEYTKTLNGIDKVVSQELESIMNSKLHILN